MKETLSDKIFETEIVLKGGKYIYTEDVRGFIQWVLDEISAFGKFERINGAKTNGLKYRIKKRAGEELINPTTESPNFRGLPDTTLSNHSPQNKEIEVSPSFEDTQKGVFIERAGKLDEKGIRAVCGTEEEYAKYVKDNKKGCGKLIFIHFGEPIYCGKEHKGKIQLCDACSGEDGE